MYKEEHEEAKEKASKDEVKTQVEQDKFTFRGFPYCHLVVFPFSMLHFAYSSKKKKCCILCLEYVWNKQWISWGFYNVLAEISLD